MYCKKYFYCNRQNSSIYWHKKAIKSAVCKFTFYTFHVKSVNYGQNRFIKSTPDRNELVGQDLQQALQAPGVLYPRRPFGKEGMVAFLGSYETKALKFSQLFLIGG
jgi:hypothetical protein